MEQALGAYLRYAREVSSARSASLFRLSREGHLLELAASSHEKPWSRPRSFRVGQGLLGRAAATGESQICHDVPRDPRFVAEDAEVRPGAVYCGPIQDQGGLCGVLNLAWDPQCPPPSAEVLDLLRRGAIDLVSSLAAPPTHRRIPAADQLARARRLQSSLLPRPSGPGDRVRTEIVYRPYHDVGGDLLAVFRNPDRTLLAITDACGHDAASALASTMARGLLRREFERGLAPGDLLEALDEVLAAELGAAWFVTAAVLEIESRTGRLRWSTAGHPSPLLARPGALGFEALETSGAPLGLGAGGYRTSETLLDPGTALVLLSDGAEGALGLATGALPEVQDLLGAPAPVADLALARSRIEARIAATCEEPLDDVSVLLATLEA